MNPGSDETWFAVASPDLEARGEIRQPTDLRAAQFAQMMSRLLGLKYENPDRRPADEPAIIFEKMPQPSLFEIPKSEPVSDAAELQIQAKK